MKAEKIKLRVDFNKKDMISKNVTDFIYVVNEKVIPLMEEFEMEMTRENVMRYANNPSLLKRDKVHAELKAANLGNEYLNKLLSQDIGERFDLALRRYNLSGVRTRYPEMVIIEEGKAKADVDAIDEAATVSIDSPEEMEAYSRHKKAVDALNAFFLGKAPEGITIANYFPVVDGVVKQGTSIVNYKQFTSKH